jgi:hypothetical protein
MGKASQGNGFLVWSGFYHEFEKASAYGGIIIRDLCIPFARGLSPRQTIKLSSLTSKVENWTKVVEN